MRHDQQLDSAAPGGFGNGRGRAAGGPCRARGPQRNRGRGGLSRRPERGGQRPDTRKTGGEGGAAARPHDQAPPPVAPRLPPPAPSPPPRPPLPPHQHTPPLS